MAWIFRLLALFTSWTKLKSSVAQTKESVNKVSRAASGIQQKHTQESFEKALGGDLNAAYDLGERHYDGRGLPQDYQQAAQWFARAANLGHPKAQTTLGLMFLAGRGVRKNPTKARELLVAAAKQGDSKARETLEKLNQAARR